MPAKTGKQYRLMAAAMKGNLKGAAPPVSVAKEFVEKTPKKKRKMFARS